MNSSVSPAAYRAAPPPPGRRPVPLPVHDRVVGALDPVPAAIAVHRVVAAADRRDAGDALEIGGTAGRRRVPAVGECVHVHPLDALAGGELDQRRAGGGRGCGRRRRRPARAGAGPTRGRGGTRRRGRRSRRRRRTRGRRRCGRDPDGRRGRRRGSCGRPRNCPSARPAGRPHGRRRRAACGDSAAHSLSNVGRRGQLDGVARPRRRRSPTRPGRPGRRAARSSSRGGGDRGQVGRVEARAADQAAVDVRLGEELRRVRRLDAAAVLDAHLLAALRAGPPPCRG